MLTTMMLSALLALTAQPASHSAQPGPSHIQTAPLPPAPPPSPPKSPPQRTSPSNDAPQIPAAKGGTAPQREIDHSPVARSNWDHRRAYYWQYYRRPYRRGYGNAVSSGVRVIQGVPTPPVSIQAVHNLDATVTVTWVMPGGVIQEGDIFEVGRRQPGQKGFSNIGQTTQPRFVDRQLQTLTSGTQYAVAVRRGNQWSPMSAAASSRPNHPLAPQRAQPVPPKPNSNNPSNQGVTP